MNLDQRLEEVEAILSEAAVERAATEACDEKRKQVLSVMVVHYRGEGNGIAEAEHRARASAQYKQAADEWIMANFKYRRADAKAEAERLKIDVWRTKASTERAKMQLR